MSLARRGILVWSAALIAVLVAALGLHQHREFETVIRQMSAGYDAMAQARHHVATALIVLATTEQTGSEQGPTVARAELELAILDLRTADASIAAFSEADIVQRDLMVLIDSLQALQAGSLSELNDADLAARFDALAHRLRVLEEGVQHIEAGAQARMNQYFQGAAATLGLLMTVLLGLAVVHTIQFRRAAERQEAAEAEARFQAQLVQTITEGTTDAVVMKDLQGRYIYLNSAAEEQLGTTRCSVLGRTTADIFGDAAGRRGTEVDARVMASRVTETLEEHFTLQGVRRTLLVTKAAAIDAFGEVAGILAVSRDITARKGEEDALRESQSRLSMALRAARLGAWSIDLVSGAVDWSPEILTMTGRVEPIRHLDDFAAHIGDADRQRVLAAITAALASGARFEETFDFRTASGEVRTITVWGEVRCDAACRPLAATGVVMDVSDRMRMEHALHESEEQYRHFLDALPDAVFLNEGDIVTYCNDAFLALRGADDPAEVIGRPVYELFPIEERERVCERIAYIRSTGLALPAEERHVRRLDGRLVPVLATGVHVTQYAAGSILVVMRDLTRERYAAAWSSSILDHALDGIVTTNADGVILSVNRAAEALFGYQAREVIGRHIGELVPSAMNGAGNQRLETTGRRADGSEFPIDAAVSAFELDREVHVIAVIRDISDRRALESELRQAHKMEALGQVAGGVAHDFNNLLTVILGYSEILQDQLPKADPRRTFASDIRRAAGRAADLTRQLLAFSRRTVVAPKVLDPNSVVADMNRMLRRVLGEDIQLVTELRPMDRRIYMDAGALEQIVMNLAINARDAMPAGGRLTVTTGLVTSPGGTDAAGAPFEARDYVVLSVTDTGTGIPEAVRSRIFEAFFTTKELGKGTGLGLAVVHSVVRQNGGFIDLESRPGHTRFTIGLPAVVEAESAQEPAPAPVRGHGETVLVVEDEEPVRRLACITLTRGGYRVLEAESLAAALEVFERAHGAVDLVVTDVVMPNGGGRDLADALAQRRPGLPVLFTSGYADDATLRYGISRQEVPFLAKPYAPAALLEHVRRLLDQLRANV